MTLSILILNVWCCYSNICDGVTLLLFVTETGWEGKGDLRSLQDDSRAEHRGQLRLQAGLRPLQHPHQHVRLRHRQLPLHTDPDGVHRLVALSESWSLFSARLIELDSAEFNQAWPAGSFFPLFGPIISSFLDENYSRIEIRVFIVYLG